MFIDLHIHTDQYSLCSRLKPEELVYTARLFGLDGIAITEHNCLWEEGEIAELKHRTKTDDLVILRGQEIRAYKDGFLEGDLLVFGIDEVIRDELSSHELVERVHQAGGIILAAHPFRPFLGLGDTVYNLNLDGIEVLNSNHAAAENIAAETARRKLNIPGIGGSDAHCAIDVGNYLTFFEDRIETEAALVAAIKAGHCRAISFSEMYNK